jgi:hypothetical protein
VCVCVCECARALLFTLRQVRVLAGGLAGGWAGQASVLCENSGGEDGVSSSIMHWVAVSEQGLRGVASRNSLSAVSGMDYSSFAVDITC